MPSASIHTHPEHIHPALWRGSQLAQGLQAVLPTGFEALDRQLPGSGWPLGTLIELLPSQPGIGEISLLSPALARLAGQRSIIFVQPPWVPHQHYWMDGPPGCNRLLWLDTSCMADALWACEQALRHNACAALLCWLDSTPPQALRRLQLAARGSDTLLAVLRPAQAASQASVAPLRLAVQPARHGLDIRILKRRGPVCEQIIPLTLHAGHATSPASASHVLGLPASAYARSGRPVPALAH